MKKIISTLLAFCMVLSVSITAFASEKPKSDDVLKEIESTINYLTNGVTAYDVDDAVTYYYLTETGSGADKFYDAFAESVLKSLQDNGGKIIGSYGENITTTAACVSIIGGFDNPAEFHGYNLVELLENSDTSTVTNPYYYDIVISTASLYCSDELIKTLCDDFINNYYTLGSGMDYYGNGCDNDAMFASAISQSLLSEYTSYAKDAIEVMDKNYKVDGGYCFNPAYSTASSPDSVGLALRAKCAYFLFAGEPAQADFDELATIYNQALSFKGATPGSYNYDGAESILSSTDILKGLNLYYYLLLLNEKNEEVTETTTTAATAAPTTKPSAQSTTTAKANTSKKSPSTGGNTITALCVAVLGAGLITAVARKKGGKEL